MTTNHQAEQLILANAAGRRVQFGVDTRAGRIAIRLANQGVWVRGWRHAVARISYPRTGRVGIEATPGAVGLHALARSYPQGGAMTWGADLVGRAL